MTKTEREIRRLLDLNPEVVLGFRIEEVSLLPEDTQKLMLSDIQEVLGHGGEQCSTSSDKSPT